MTAFDPLFSPLRLGAFTLSHRVVMPAVNRGRAALPEAAPDALMTRYYAQRATAGGLIISESAYVCAAGHRVLTRPGIYTVEQVNRWRAVTDAVHQSGGIVLAQLAYEWELPMTPSEVDDALEAYRSAAENAGDAGFDGIELHAADGSLPANILLNQPAAHAQQLLLDIVQTLRAVWAPSRTGVSLPSDPPADLLHTLAPQGLAYLHVLNSNGGRRTCRHSFYSGAVILSGGFSAESAAQAIASGHADAIGFGEEFVANPDLPLRIRLGAVLAHHDPATLEVGGERGYTDYPELGERK